MNYTISKTALLKGINRDDIELDFLHTMDGMDIRVSKRFYAIESVSKAAPIKVVGDYEIAAQFMQDNIYLAIHKLDKSIAEEVERLANEVW